MSLLPFTTAWMAHTGLAPAPVALYAGLFVLVNATYLLLFRVVGPWAVLCLPGVVCQTRGADGHGPSRLEVRLGESSRAENSHKSMTTSPIGCEQQTRTLPSAGFSSGSGL
jgi:hypothetical protein